MRTVVGAQVTALRVRMDTAWSGTKNLVQGQQSALFGAQQSEDLSNSTSVQDHETSCKRILLPGDDVKPPKRARTQVPLLSEDALVHVLGHVNNSRFVCRM